MENILKTLMKEREVYRLSGADANKLTRECLQKALVSLMGEKPFEGISVTELVRRAGVSRQSFYRNYASKEEILSDMWKNICQKASEAVSVWKYKANIRQWYYDLFAFIKDNGAVMEPLLKAGRYLKNDREVLRVFPDESQAETPELRYQLLSYKGALIGIISEWFQQGMKEEISYMAELCSGMLGSYHRRLLGMAEDAEAAALWDGGL